jgi:hypothetical protein
MRGRNRGKGKERPGGKHEGRANREGKDGSPPERSQQGQMP